MVSYPNPNIKNSQINWFNFGCALFLQSSPKQTRHRKMRIRLTIWQTRSSRRNKASVEFQPQKRRKIAKCLSTNGICLFSLSLSYPEQIMDWQRKRSNSRILLAGKLELDLKLKLNLKLNLKTEPEPKLAHTQTLRAFSTEVCSLFWPQFYCCYCWWQSRGLEKGRMERERGEAKKLLLAFRFRWSCWKL